MSMLIPSQPVPLREEANGVLRVGNTRVLFELVVLAFNEGATPEAIVQSYDTLQLADVYAVLAYFLNHRVEVEAYLRERDARAAEIRAKINARQGDMAEVRARLQARRVADFQKRSP